MKEEIFGAEFKVQNKYGQVITIDYLPKIQARKLYQFAQQMEEKQIEVRRQLELEEKRAGAGGVTVTAAIPHPNADNAPKQEDPLAALQKLKALLENDLITQTEFDTKKAEILARL
jgi:predicted flavoprotein YhiN